MEHEYKIELSKRRLEIAHERLTTAKAMLDGFDSKKHSGIIARFRQSYIKTGILDTEMSKIIDDLEVIREDSDYDDFYIILKEDVEIQAKRAEYFVSEVESYLQNQYNQ